MKTSNDGLNSLTVREGTRHHAYQDTKGIWTIGVGHTGPDVYHGLVWDDDQIRAALMIDVEEAETAVNTVSGDLTQSMFDALVSFVFNVGVHRFKTSTMYRVLNSGYPERAADEFDKYHIPVSIIGRRDSEKDQFLA